MKITDNQEILNKDEVLLPATRVCKKCNIKKLHKDFKTNKQCKFGISYVCKNCDSLRLKEWTKSNVEKRKEIQQRYRDNNKETVKLSNKTYIENNKDKVKMSRIKAKLKRQSRHLFLNDEFNIFVTEEAHHLRGLRDNLTGIKWHVDHIIPLQGKTVSGLHVWNNLQVIPAIENLRKNNKYENF